MKVLPSGRVVFWLCLAASFLVVGCGPPEPPKYKATGKILLNGQPLTLSAQGPPGGSSVKIQFLPDVGDPAKLVDPKESTYDAATGKFTVVGLDGKGLEAGKYRVAVYLFDPYPTDKLGGKFSAPITPIKVQVQGAEDLAPIELSQFK